MTVRNLSWALLFTCNFFNVQAQPSEKQPVYGFTSKLPATNWQEALLSGNGTMGAMIYGLPYDETIIVNHTDLFLPRATSGTYIKQADKIKKIQQLLLGGKYREAAAVPQQLRKEAGYFDSRDPFIPGFDLRIQQQGAVSTFYSRSVNFETGEATVQWKDPNGDFTRKVFVSRPDSLMIIQIKGTGKINCSLFFQEHPTQNAKELADLDNNFAERRTGLTTNWLFYRAKYKNHHAYNRFEGYEGVAKIINIGGSRSTEDGKIRIKDADEVLILAQIGPVVHYSDSCVAVMERFINCKEVSYDQLLARHASIHGALFNKVKLNLNADTADLNLNTEALIKKAQDGPVPLAMIEKAFNAGRYNIISCSGKNPPNLQGIWSGTWASNWAGSYTTDGNLETAMAFNLPGDLPELMQGYFDYNDRMMEGYRKNAQELFGCRGIHIPAQLTTTPLETDFSVSWPLIFWTGGAGWAAKFYNEYYQYTGDREFLARRGYPFMKEAALFYEDFLKIEQNGKYVFVPSYSPENTPSGNGSQACVNATMDIMIARQLLNNCISCARILHIDEIKIKLWQKMLAKMPDYEVSADGVLKEWMYPGEPDNYDHRHASHLYALYDQVPAEFKHHDILRDAAVKAIEHRLNWDMGKGNGEMAFGMAQIGWSAAHLGDTGHVQRIIDWLCRNSWSSGMASFHNKRALFNMDISGGFPYLISQALIYSEPGLLKLLPALPGAWKSGNIQGLMLQGHIKLNSLAWSQHSVTLNLFATEDQALTLQLPGKVKAINGQTIKNGISATAINLKKNQVSSLSIIFE